MPRTAVSRRPTNSSYAERSTRIRERAQQSWPALSKTAYGAVAAALATSASANTMLALLPPSSRVTRFTWSAQPAMICLPTSVEPVKQTLRTSGWVTNRSPTTEPLPGQHGEHALGQARLERQLADPDRRQRRDLGRLEHDRVAGRQRGRESPAGDGHREVPGHDHADHAERFAEGDVDAAGHRDLPAEEALGCGGVVVQAVADVARLPAGVADRVAGVLDLEPGQLLDVRVDDGGERSAAAGPARPGRRLARTRTRPGRARSRRRSPRPTWTGPRAARLAGRPG